MAADAEIEVVFQQGRKLDADQAALGGKGSVLLDAGQEMRGFRAAREDDGFAVQGACFGAADIEDVESAARRGRVTSVP